VIRANKARCYNCGAANPSTKDHVISKTLIPEPRPTNLITVPACKECNGSYSQDEEYLKDRLSSVIGHPGHFQPQIWSKVWQSMQKPQTKGRKVGLLKDVILLKQPVLTDRGVSAMGIRVQKTRSNRVVEKMIKGFYYHHFKKRLDGVTFHIDLLSSINPNRNSDKIAELIINVIKSPSWSVKFGDRTWVACQLLEEDSRGGLWVIGLFGGHIVFVVVMPLVLLSSNG
jgi:hypothetical protein